MEKDNFRVLLDFSELVYRRLDSLHKFIWMLISTIDIKTIGDLKSSLASKFGLSSKEFNLFMNEGLLLEDEKIIILRENDIVRILYEQPQNSFNQTSVSMERNDTELSQNANNNNESNISKQCKKKRKKRRQNEDFDKAEIGSNESFGQPEIFHLFNEADITPKQSKRKKYMIAISKTKESNNESFSHCDIQKEIVDLEKEVNVKPKQSKKKEIVQCEDENKTHVKKNSESINVVEKSNYSKKSKTHLEDSHEVKNEEIIDTTYNDNNVLIFSSEPISGEHCKLGPNNISNPSFILGSSSKKRKRKRHRKRKVEHIPLNTVLPTIEFLECNQSDNMSSENNVRKHIRYTSPTPKSNDKKREIMDTKKNNLDSPADISMCVELANEFASRYYSNFPVKSNESKSSNTEKFESIKNETDIINFNENDKLLDENVNSHGCKTSDFVMNSTISISDIAKEERNKNCWSISPVKKEQTLPTSDVKECNSTTKAGSYANFPLISTLPTINSRIAFKLLELNENYSPEVSKYKEGVIKSINPKTEELEIELTTAEIKSGRTGKFENLKVDEMPPDEVVETVSVSWSSLIEPKLIESS